MNIKWTRGLDVKQAKELKAQIADARPVLQRLVKLLEDELEQSRKEMANKDNFFMPAWSEYQAHRLGEQEAIKMLIEFIKE